MRIVIAGLILPLYLVPLGLRWILVALAGQAGWVASVVISDSAGALFTGFLTNNYWFGALIYVCSTALEVTFLLLGHHQVTAFWIGDLMPALVAIYFAQQLYVNMGD